jgi:integrase
MASITARKTKGGSTVYRVLIRRKGERPMSAHFEKLGMAREWAAQTEVAIKEGRYFKAQPGEGKTLNELLDKYIAEELPKRRLDRQKTVYQLVWWRGQLGHLYLKALRPAVLSECRERLIYQASRRGRPMASSTVNQYMAGLSQVFSIAVKEWEWMDENPMQKVRRCKLPKGRTRFLSDAERERLLAACRESTSPYLYAVVVVAICTGARFGEILGLRWEDIDFDRRIMRLEQTKNGEKRAVPLAAPAFAEVLKLREARRGEAPWVFRRSCDTKRPIELRKHWFIAIKKAGIADFRFHDLRHTAASYLAMNSASLLEIAAVLGHKTLAMVQRYSHITDQHTSAILDRMTGKVFGDEGNSTPRR